MKKLLSFVLFFLVGSTLYAGGYRVAIQGQKQLAMGHTGVAVISSAESVFFNPASMSFLDGKFNVSLGGSAIFGQVGYENAAYGHATETNNPLGTPVNFYATYKLNDHFTVGFGVYTPYGSSVEWEKDWEGSHLVNNIALKAIFFQPTIALKVSDQLSIGGGPIYARGSVVFNKNLNRTLTDTEGNRANVTVEGTGISAWGYSVGVLVKPTDKLNIGFNYRSKIDMVVEDGEADFENVPASLPGDYSDTTFNAELPMPAEITLGLSYQMTNKFLVAFDYNFAQWSAYEALTVSFNNAAGTSVSPRNYQDSSTYRLGLQFKATDKLMLRGGVYFDESPVQDGYFAPETPRNDSMGYTGGLSYQITDKLCIDASVLYLQFDEIENSYDHYQENGQNVPFGGTYKSAVFSPGIGISYKL